MESDIVCLGHYKNYLFCFFKIENSRFLGKRPSNLPSVVGLSVRCHPLWELGIKISFEAVVLRL